MPSPKVDDEAQKRKLLELPSIIQIGDHMTHDIVVENNGSIFIVSDITFGAESSSNKTSLNKMAFSHTCLRSRYTADIVKGIGADYLGA